MLFLCWLFHQRYSLECVLSECPCTATKLCEKLQVRTDVHISKSVSSSLVAHRNPFYLYIQQNLSTRSKARFRLTNSYRVSHSGGDGGHLPPSYDFVQKNPIKTDAPPWGAPPHLKKKPSHLKTPPPPWTMKPPSRKRFLERTINNNLKILEKYVWRSSFLVNLQACRLIAGNFIIKWTPSQVFLNGILTPPSPPCLHTPKRIPGCNHDRSRKMITVFCSSSWSFSSPRYITYFICKSLEIFMEKVTL